MSFDRNTRNALARMVGQVRELLKFDVMDQLRRLGFQADGCVLDLDQIAGLSELERMAGRELRDLLEHFVALESGPGVVRRQAAYDRLAREIGFTTLNRLVALRMAEERGLIVQAVGRGLASDGFQIYERVARDALGNHARTYRAYLECLYDELALDLPMLFDRTTPESRIFPSERCLQDVLTLLNDASLAHLWKEDEAIGWVYQYYNDPDERKKMREAAQAPRNSRELAVRNQFFTPRYVVEFLTDNTLGRLWYEMRQGNTQLSDQCRYLVHRPVEIFLQDGEEAPQSAEPEEDLRREELLNRPVFIPYRVKKDPRDLKILDPACGSGHFLLYAFDLLETIYEEAWADSASPISEVTGTRLRNDYADLDALRHAVPGLILRHNLYGIDIDPRACQIAALALWLRAQRSYQQLGLPAAERPPITKSNIVCAEPMPGERETLEEYLKEHVDPRLQPLVRTTWGKMWLAGEAGSLLKIEEEIETALAEAREQALVDIPPVQHSLLQRDQPGQIRLTIPASDERTFWEQAEEKLLAALRDYASKTTNGHLTQRRLFAEDAARGFAFIDLYRNRFDIVLMNPPFGAVSQRTLRYCTEQFPDTVQEVAYMFVARMEFLLQAEGLIGCITTRLGFFITTLSEWRARRLNSGRSILVCADLGYGVLDAVVETAAYVVAPGKRQSKAIFVDLLEAVDKQKYLQALIVRARKDYYDVDTNAFQGLPGAPFAYWAPGTLLDKYKQLRHLEPAWALVKRGPSTNSNERFFRLAWEVSPDLIGQGKRWIWCSRGEEYSPYFMPMHLLLDWLNDGEPLKTFVDDFGRPRATLKNLNYFFKPGLTYASRTTSGFAPRVMPAGSGFDQSSNPIFPVGSIPPEGIAGFLLTRPVLTYVELAVGAGDTSQSGTAARNYTNGMIGGIPVPNLSDSEIQRFTALGRQCIDLMRATTLHDELAPDFITVTACSHRALSLREVIRLAVVEELNAKIDIIQLSGEMDRLALSKLGVSPEEAKFISDFVGPHPNEYPLAISESTHHEAKRPARVSTKKCFWSDREIEVYAHEQGIHPKLLTRDPRFIAKRVLDALQPEVLSLVSYCVGCKFGRWDIRKALDTALAGKLADIFAPLAACTPGALVGPDGLPAGTGNIVSEEWLRIRPDANTLLPEKAVQHPTIPDSEYPIQIAWNGILVDDPEHPADIIRCIREVLGVLWSSNDGAQADVIEQEACEILGVKDLRDYFRRPAGFFEDHLKRYSKSRRQAPIYWPLSTVSGSYTLWVYYHRLTSDTLFTAINRYVDPKIANVHRSIGEMGNKLASTTGRDATRLRSELEDAHTFLGELCDFRDELLRVAGLPYQPDLNDGVVITAAPLHRLFRLPKWAKDTKECWEELQRGEYDWAHLAYTIWPDRVREKCRADYSLAIAHNLEHLYVVRPNIARRKRSHSTSL